MAIVHFKWLVYLKVNTRRVIHITIKPMTKAIATDRNIPIITESALSVLISSAYVNPWLNILEMAKAELPPNNPNTIETVVEVGIPKVLKMSIKMMSVVETARKMHITSSKV